MDTLGDDVLKAFDWAFQDPATRCKMMKALLEAALHLNAEAVALEDMWLQEKARSEQLQGNDDAKLWSMSVDRAKRIHRERCHKLSEAAVRVREAMKLACGTLTIDETTADTGLDEDQRSLLSQVSGRCARW